MLSDHSPDIKEVAHQWREPLRVLARHGGLLSSADIGHRASLWKSSTRLALLDAETNSPGDKKQRLKSLWVYGSVARGDDRLGSDLDVGVVAEAIDLTAVVETVRDSLAVHSERLGFSSSVVGLDMEDVSRQQRWPDR